MATIVIKSRLGGSASFAEFEKSAGGEMEVDESSTIFFLPRLVGATDGSVSNRVMTHLRAILGEEGMALDADKTHIFRIGIDPMTAIGKLFELGFYAANSCSESQLDGGSVMSWTMLHDNKKCPPAAVINRGRVSTAVENGETAEEEPAAEENESEYAPSEPDADDDADQRQKKGRGRPLGTYKKKKGAAAASQRQSVTVTNGTAGRRVIHLPAAKAKATPPARQSARAAKIAKPSPAASKQKLRAVSQDDESFGSQEADLEGIEDTRRIVSELTHTEIEQHKGYVTSTNDRLGTEEAERLLFGKTKIEPLTEMPRKAPGGSVWLYTDQGEPWRSRDYMSDGYRMQQCSTRMWPAQNPVLCVIQYRVIVADRQSNDFCRYVMMLPSALHATAAECQNMRHGRRPSERTPFFYLIHYVGDHGIAVDVEGGGRRGPHRTLPSRVFMEHMERGEKLKPPKSGLPSSQESDMTNDGGSDDEIQEIPNGSSVEE